MILWYAPHENEGIILTDTLDSKTNDIHKTVKGDR